MAKGQVWRSEIREYKDRATGVKVKQMTDYNANSYLPYFTSNTWFDNNKKIVFCSERQNSVNLFSLDIRDGEMVQLTEYTPEERNLPMGLVYEKNPIKEELYFWHGRELMALDMRTLAERVVYIRPEGHMDAGVSCTADGKNLCLGITEDIGYKRAKDGKNDSVSFEENWKLKPHSTIFLIDIERGKEKVVYEEDAWLTHINPSPVKENIITYCHEGPWEKVDQRIWGLDLSNGKKWDIRPKNGGECFGHEFWLKDGVTLGYHGWREGEQFFGKIRYDNSDWVEVIFPASIQHIHHIHFNDFSMMVADSFADYPAIRIWKNVHGKVSWPRVLCEHRSSFHFHPAHAHPRFTPDGKKVLYTSNVSGYCNVYMVDLPDFESLPEVSR